MMFDAEPSTNRLAIGLGTGGAVVLVVLVLLVVFLTAVIIDKHCLVYRSYTPSEHNHTLPCMGSESRDLVWGEASTHL